MKVTTLARLAWKHAKNHAAEELYIRTGRDLTHPVSFYGYVNERCNVKCRYCEWWRLDKYKQEMTIEQWKAALLSVKKFVGEFSINFSGGEPFIKKGFVDLMVWCHENGIHSGVTTNGSAFSPRVVERLIAAQPFNINVSVDAPDAKTHDYLRGTPGLHENLTAGIRRLREARDRAGLDFPIIIKPTMNSANFRAMPEMAAWSQSVGASCVNFQAMDRWTPETYDELWIEEPDHEELQGVMDTLIEQKRAGAPILNSELILSLTVKHFRGESAPPETLPCRVGLRDFFIWATGDVAVCFFYPNIGNLKEKSAREIWYGEEAQKIRKQTVECDRLCLYTCLSQKTLADKVKMGLNLLRNQKREAPAPAVEGAAAV